MKRPVPWLTLALAATALASHLLPSAADWLQYDRAALAQGELWRLITAHVAHFDANHLAWDLGVVLAFGLICERRAPTVTRVACAVSALSIPVLLWVLQPQFIIYRGLSGLACALVGVYVGDLLVHPKSAARFLGWIATAGFLAKCGYEMATAHTLFADGITYVPVPLAHGVGFATGLCTALIATRIVTDSSPTRRDPVANPR